MITQFLDSSDVKLHRTLEKLPAGAYTCDAEGLITYFNQSAVALWGREPKLNDPTDRYCGSFKLFSADDGSPIPHDQCWMALALRNGKAYTEQEIAIERPDGSRWIALAHANPFLNEQGQIVGAVNVLLDISGRKQEEKTRRELAAIVESSDDAIVSKDLNGIIRSWNAAALRLFGYTAQEAVGRHISMLIPADRADEEEGIIARLRAGERVYHFDTVRVSKDGQLIPVSLTISPIRDESGRIVGASKIARDISDRKRDELRIYALMTQLKEADARKNDFLATLAHEIRNPLAPLRTLLEVMRHKGGDGDWLHHAIDKMERQVEHVVRLVDDLWDVSRINRNKLELRKGRVELASIIQQSLDVSRPLAERSKHELNVSLPSEPIYLQADSVRLVQVFSNLLNNACKYTEPGGRICLSAVREGSDAVVKVKDTGTGIPADKLGGIFNLFEQVDRSMERSQGGLGIGLALVKWLVEMHGGSVEAYSEGQGRGSEFVVRLPITIEKSKAEKPITKQSQATTYRILVVDDNKDAADSLAILLTTTGNETRTAYDGLEAVEAAERYRPEVILLDIALPKLSGHDACRRIRQQPWGKDIVIIALTGWGHEEDRRMSTEAGFTHHIVKPLEYSALMRLLSELKTN